MILITGGAFQGKTAYTEAHFHYEITDGASCDLATIRHAQILNRYHETVRRLMAENMDAEAFTRNICAENPNCIVLIDEVGSGIVPMEKQERIWRESVGRCGCILAQHAHTVIRCICGIPVAIKGDLP
ncbi:MAG: bifunctional adenosylcobinamide kinase/adenosylcobinamide-phosphate guanylyltransferase [Oscillospiraceae bacterium]|nr:bifunctional adenosylcobinamide kinase/adenosylcobinamide-phosphate guanylyltransferase [Oscillospiraceae bacterium]